MTKKQKEIGSTKEYEKDSHMVGLSNNKSVEIKMSEINVKQIELGGYPYFVQDIVLLKNQEIKRYDPEKEEVITEKIKENRPSTLKFSSKRLKRYLQEHADELINKALEIEKEGKGYETIYHFYGTENR